MADILLAHSYHLAYDPKQLRKMQPYPPLGTLYAATALREHHISVAVFDPMLQDPTSSFPEVLRRQQPKVLAIYEDVVVLAHFKDQSWKVESYSKRTVSLYFVKRAELFICMAMKIARA